MPWLSKSCVYIPFPKHVCGHERWPSFRCNAFSRWHTTLSVLLLKYHVWCVYAADSLQRRWGNLKFIPIQSDWEALELWKEAACFFHPCDSTESWVPCHFFTAGIWSPACIALISDKMLKVKCMLARPTLLPFKMHGIVSFVNNKICWRFGGCVNYAVTPRRVDGRVWRGRERAEWYLMCSDQEGDCEAQTAQGRPEPDWLHCNYSLQRSVRRRSVLRQRLPPPIFSCLIVTGQKVMGPGRWCLEITWPVSFCHIGAEERGPGNLLDFSCPDIWSRYTLDLVSTSWSSVTGPAS